MTLDDLEQPKPDAVLSGTKEEQAGLADVLLTDDDPSSPVDRMIGDDQQAQAFADRVASALEARRKPSESEAMRRQLAKLEALVKAIRSGNTPDEYITQDGKLNYLKYEDLKEQRDELRQKVASSEFAAQQRLRDEQDSQRMAKERARESFRERIVRVPDSLRVELAKEYEASFNQIRDWIPLTQNRATLERALQVLFDTALGKAVLKQPEVAGRPASGLENAPGQTAPVKKTLDKEQLVPAAVAFLKAARHPDFNRKEP